MPSPLSLTFLGTGTSTGVPVIGCDCPVCTSDDPRNIHTRSSVYLDTPAGKILVDSGPDLREQALRENLRQVDAVLYTHAHLDHITGFDDLRAFCWRREDPLPMYGSNACIDELKRVFSWAFAKSNTHGGYIKPDPICFTGPFQLDQLRITPLLVNHASVETHGYRFDYPGAASIAYISDVKSIPAQTIIQLENIDILIIDALKEGEHPTHMGVQEAIDTAEKVNAKQVYLTHISHSIDYAELEAKLPPHIHIAYDGLKI
ncbi:MBL fold metallo-hydrolase [Persicirhabdus sediminis]|uniref:MBL fold metallo-hydrolase n=1 Tax=Persicirhabdus sediminis TaxID=454144 RepID=A0A8J7MAJ8_9BACT|nr:MBL fold metallo-hydrolase [Persicirhabdus sediminis]MBK1789969.1 MBL fold metallo-hydrolase [Persicirhabdus sediminis]